MHAEVAIWVAHCLNQRGPLRNIAEIGGRDINGSIRTLFDVDARYCSIDIVDGPGVDVVGDVIDLVATGKLSTGRWDCVVSTEALEHHPRPWEVVDAAHQLLAPGGVFIATMAGPGRSPHSGLIEGPVQPGEHYQNITPEELTAWLAAFADFAVDQAGRDVRCWAVK